MFKHQYEDAPKGTLAHTGYMLYLADLRFKAEMLKALGIRKFARWVAKH